MVVNFLSPAFQRLTKGRKIINQNTGKSHTLRTNLKELCVVGDFWVSLCSTRGILDWTVKDAT